MSTIKVNAIKNTSTDDGGIAIDNSGHVQIDGQQLATAGALSNRNLIINGAMTVAQRGTGNFPIGDDDFPVDRFLFSNVGSGFTGGANGTQSTTAPNGFKNSLEVDVTTADTSLTSDSQGKIEYRVEGNDSAHLNWGTANAQTVTLSFYIKSNVTGESAVAFVNESNNRSYVATFNINTANTWERKELTVAGPTDGTWNTSNGIGIRLRWGSFGSSFQTTSTNQWLSTQKMTSSSSINFFTSTDNNLFLTGVQLELGQKATPFEHRSYGDELARCQRYYYRHADRNSDEGRSVGNVALYQSSRCFGAVHFPVTMRATPTLDASDFTNAFKCFANANNQGFEGFAGIQETGTTSCVLESDSTLSLTAGAAGWVRCEGSTAQLSFNAEL